MTSSPTTAADLTRFEIAGRDDEPHRFSGILLGVGTSRADEHTDHRGEFAARGEKCSACRWFEVAVYARFDVISGSAVPRPRDYVVHTVGGTAVRGEDRRSRVSYTSSAYEVIELLTVRPHHGEPFITQQSARALAQAASLDEGIRDAYVNRAII